MSRKDAIHEALSSVYAQGGRVTYGTMIEACAKDLDRRYSELEARAVGKDRDEPLLYEVHMVIWNWFPGGGTAEIAARKVIAAVEKEKTEDPK